MGKAIQVSCVQTHWAKPLEFNLERTLHYIKAASEAGSRVVLFPEASLTGYYFPYAGELNPAAVASALTQTCSAARTHNMWVIAGTIRKTSDRFLNIAHVINPAGVIVHEYAKVNMAGKDELKYCRGGGKLSLFEIDGILCTLVICRDGRHPELYRIPAMAGAQILFHPSCSSDEIEAVCWKRDFGARAAASRPELENIPLRREHCGGIPRRQTDLQRLVVHQGAEWHPTGRGRILSGGDDNRRPGYRARRPLIHPGQHEESALPGEILERNGQRGEGQGGREAGVMTATQKVYSIISQHGPICRADIHREFKIRPATITRITEGLLKKNLIRSLRQRRRGDGAQPRASEDKRVGVPCTRVARCPRRA